MKIKNLFIIVFVIFIVSSELKSFFLFPLKQDYYRYNLSNSDWKFRQIGKDRWMKAVVPGCVHTDLLNLKIIQDPFYGLSGEKYHWIENNDWEYKTEFIIPYKILNSDKIELVFKGLDTFADVYLNNILILRANNFFRIWKVDIKNHIKRGLNRLTVKFTSPLKIIKNFKEKYPHGKPIADYIFIRKPAYQFGWDWAPKFPTMGIWKPVYIIGWKNISLNNVKVIKRYISKRIAILDFEFEIYSLKKQKAKINVSSKKLHLKIKKKVSLSKGINYKTVGIIIKNPKLWYPYNIGTPNLYDFSVKIYQGRKIRAKWEKSIGIRTLKLIREKDKLGESFYFKINGKPLFIKGANYVPQDVFLNRVRKQDYERILKDAVKSNINMLRVWGGGFYEKDIFYTLCDKYGILVWQDFMFACAMYPGDKSFIENVKQEVIYNIKRLRNHPSLAIWCGNNENYEGWNHWGWQDSYSDIQKKEIWNDYKKIFFKLLPNLVKKYDGERDYIHTSPLTNWGGILNTKGDVHYWGIWHGKEVFENFTKHKKIGRFVSEYGFQSFPNIKTINSFTMEKDRKLFSEVLKYHEKHPIGFKLIQKYMELYFRKPKNFYSFVYISQLLQAYGIGMGIEAHRRYKPSCMGTLFWQLNDCWSGISWSSIDWLGRWKALQYGLKTLYSNILISPFIENKKLRIYIINDNYKNIKARLKFILSDFSGNISKSFTKDVDIISNSSSVYFEDYTNNVLEYYNKAKIVLKTELYIKDKKIAEKYFYFVKPKDLNLEKPNIKVGFKKIEGGYKLIISTDKLAKNIYIEFKNLSGFLSDNYFDLLPNETKTIIFKTDETIEKLKKEIRIISLYDSYNN